MRLRTAQNAALAGAPSAELTAALGNAGRNDDATIRCEALCSMAKLDFAAATGLLEAAAKDSNPLVRLGAVRGYAAAGKTDKALPFLDDPSEMVRLAAIRAAANEASAGAARRVMDLMIAAPQGEMRSVGSHLAAREALIAMHSRQVEELAAERLAEAMAGYRNTPREFQDLIGQYSKPPPAGQTREDFSVAAAALREHQSVHVRNVRSCCRILGAYRSRLALARLLDLVKTEPTESILLGDAAWALGEIGEASAAPPLRALLAQYVKLGRKKLQNAGVIPPPPIPYNDHAAAEVISAMAKLKDAGATDDIIQLTTMSEGNGRFRLYEPVMAGLRALPELQTPASAAKIEAAFGELISVTLPDYMVQRYAAIREAGLRGRTAQLPAIEKVLAQRPSRRLISVAAWACWKLSGQMPEIPAPPTIQSPNWIVQIHGR